MLRLAESMVSYGRARARPAEETAGDRNGACSCMLPRAPSTVVDAPAAGETRKARAIGEPTWPAPALHAARSLG